MGKCLLSQWEADNPEDRYAVCVKKEIKGVGHLPLGRLGKCAKAIFYFLRPYKLSSFKVIVTEKPVNLEGGDMMQMPCTLIFCEVNKCISILQKQIKQWNEMNLSDVLFAFLSIYAAASLKLGINCNPIPLYVAMPSFLQQGYHVSSNLLQKCKFSRKPSQISSNSKNRKLHFGNLTVK